jgi:zinc protease
MTNLTPPANWKTLPSPENITRATLANGITVLARSNFNSPSVFIGGYLASGSMYDPPGKLGLAYFTAASLMRGTQTRNFQEIYNTIESAGASLGFGASVHNVNFGGRALAEDLPILLNLLAETLCQPLFPADQVERLRAQLLTSLAIRNQDTGDMADMAFDEILFPGHPYGMPEDGQPETIQAIQVEDLRQFHHRYYRPENMVMVAVGGIDPQQAIDTIQSALGLWNNPEPPVQVDPKPIKPLAETVRRHIALPGKYQTDLILGTHGPKRLAVDYLPASLGNSILGQFGMMGRIGDVVREKAGLAYQASTSLSASIDGGSWKSPPASTRPTWRAPSTDPERAWRALSVNRSQAKSLRTARPILSAGSRFRWNPTPALPMHSSTSSASNLGWNIINVSRAWCSLSLQKWSWKLPATTGILAGWQSSAPGQNCNPKKDGIIALGHRPD